MSNFNDRRRFLRGLTYSAAGLSLAACGPDIEDGRYTQDDIDLLSKQGELESENSGRGPFGEHRYQGYRGLSELPWFELDKQGQLICVDDSIPLSIDAHAHLGMSVLFEPQLDLQASSARVLHLLDCDELKPGCELDLDVYVNGNFTAENLNSMKSNMVIQGLWGSRINRSQTIPNLIREMDSMRVEQAMILPIKLDLPFGDDLTENWRSAIQTSHSSNRLLVGFSVHPRDDTRLDQIREYARSGLKLMKLHPTVQRFFPDDPSMMEVYALAEELGIVIFFHGGRAGIEPESSHPYAMPRHYEAAFADFPKLQFVIGHAGARDNRAMIDLALRYSNTWIGIHGQGITELDRIIRLTDGQRLLFGSDWPFYHLGASLAKVLITTQDSGRTEIRQAILRGNATELFG
ncbi:MAG: putative TIM-barrel fold metal-dependent hydrolase [Arenicella sp.]|jgi:predicted TIM-barrel fold metal-dependent hydrolase